jgi:proline iminopeptidase
MERGTVPFKLGGSKSTAAPAPSKKSRPWLRRSIGIVVAVVVAIAVAYGAIIGIAVIASKPILFLVAGLIAFLLANALGISLATKSIQRSGRITAYAVSSIIVLALVVGGGIARGHGDPGARPVAGMRYWDLPTGSRLAYVHLPASGTRRSTPVVVLQGGPGVSDLAGYARFFKPLTDDGFDVFVYDQVGSGHSGRLDNPRNYTLSRDAADLEAIRRTIGARTVDLVGDSYGALLAADYMATHSHNVSRAVFASPADLDPAKFGASTIGRLSNGQIRGLVGQLIRPRALLAYTLLQVNPTAAHNFAGDKEMDGRFDKVYRQSAAALHCKKAPLGPRLTGLGFYANQFPQSAAAKPHADIRPLLRRVATPSLVIKGSCDYLSWSSAVGYMKTLPHATLEYVHNAGHDLYADQPGPVMGLIRAFLGDRALPQAPYPSLVKPSDYEGSK